MSLGDRLMGWVPRIALIILQLGLASCYVAKSYQVDMQPGPLAMGPGCHSALGSYSLPKAHFHIRVEQTGSDRPQLWQTGDSSAIEVLRRPDPLLTFCLDHLNSPMSKDDITISKNDRQNKATPFLSAVLVNATDQSSVILQALARAAFVLVSGKSDFRNGGGATAPVVHADLEFDPFDNRQMARANATLRNYGFCVVLDGVNASTTAGEAERYCANPSPSSHTLIAEAYEGLNKFTVDPFSPALFYRPRQSFRVTVYQEGLSKGHKDWFILERRMVDLENVSPLLALDITRAGFAGKEVKFGFDQGVLTVACVSKASELLGAADIPLSISRSLVELPATILSVRIDQTKKSAALVNAENQLLTLQQAQIALLQSGKAPRDYAKSADYKDVAPFGAPNYEKTNLALLSDDELKQAGFFLPPPARTFAKEAQCPGSDPGGDTK